MTDIKSIRIDADVFAPFGRVAALPSSPSLAETDEFKFWSDVADYQIEGETEIGFCEVFPRSGNAVHWMERHEQTPELLIAIDGPLVLPVMTNGETPVVRAFEFRPGEAVVIGQNVWHSACLPTGLGATRYFVIFRRGTPQEDVIKTEIPDVSIRIDS